jgi:hypothetical protein
MKITAMGFDLYFIDKYNTFDLVIVLISTMDIIYTSVSSTESSAATALRGFRLFRVFKLAKVWKKF